MDHLLSGVPAGLVPPDPVNPGHPPARAWRPGRQTQRAPLRYLVLRARSSIRTARRSWRLARATRQSTGRKVWGISSAGEHWLCKPRVKGSIPLSSTGSLEPHENRIVERSTSSIDGPRPSSGRRGLRYTHQLALHAAPAVDDVRNARVLDITRQRARPTRVR